MFLNLILSTTDRVPAWVSSSFPIIRAIILILLAISALIVIATVLMQSNSSSGGTNALSGVQESYYAQNKGTSREGRLKRVTIIASSVIAVSSIIFAIMEMIYSGY